MRLSSIAAVIAAQAGGIAFSLVAAVLAVNVIEVNSERGVRQAFDGNALPWAEVRADGLQVHVSGTAPSEALRFKAITTAGSIVDAARIIDGMEILDTRQLAPPRFSIEILRNDAGISMIGLIPAATDRAALSEALAALAGDGTVTDLLETADHPVPDGWGNAVSYAIASLGQLPRAKISVAADLIEITAVADSPDQRRRLETSLTRSAPRDTRLALQISAPRPVITPFTLRFVIEDDLPRFDACSADTPEARERILSAAVKAGLEGQIDCTIGLGVPTPSWAAAAEQAIAALAELGGGSVTFSDADITLIAAAGTPSGQFDRVVGSLENRLPDVFALEASLPRIETDGAAEIPEFTATLSPEGLLQMRGRMRDELSRSATESYAKARFGAAAVYTGARLDDQLPMDWPVRVLAAMEALTFVAHGAVTVTPDNLVITGTTGNPDASAEISRILGQKLGDGGRFDIRIQYDKRLDPIAGLPTPEECETEITEILSTRKINFEPGSATPDDAARTTLREIGAVLTRCAEVDVEMEISGHTDSQGRAEMNLALSQDRADAVLDVLRDMRVPTAGLIAKGYGMDKPVADNATEEGREANRRIEFRLIRAASGEDEADGDTEDDTEDDTGEEADAAAPDAADE